MEYLVPVLIAAYHTLAEYDMRQFIYDKRKIAQCAFFYWEVQIVGIVFKGMDFFVHNGL